MRKGSQVIGKPVVTFDSGERVVSVKDVLFDQDTNQIVGLLVDEGGLFNKAKIVRWQDVEALGPDAVIIHSREMLMTAESVPDVNSILQRNNVTKGTKLMTTDGRDLGSIADLYFDEDSGRVNGYEVSGGIFADAMSGRSFVPAPDTLQIGEDVAFVPPETATKMEEQVGGLRAAVESANERARDTVETLGERAQEATQQAKEATGNVAEHARQMAADGNERLAQISSDASAKVQESLSGAQAQLSSANRDSVESTRGRRVRYTVMTEDLTIIAAEGQIVTDEVIERAKRFGAEGKLLEAVHSDRSTAQPRPSVGDTAHDISQKGKSTLEKLKERVSDASEKSREQAKDRAIKRALGRPTTRVILDRDDNIILNTGELITNAAIQRADEADVLGILVSSVFTGAPTISEEQLSAHETGEAALESGHDKSGTSASQSA